MIDPRFGQPMPLTTFDRADAVGNGRDRQQATISALMQACEPAFKPQTLKIKIDRDRAGHRCRP